MQEMSDTENEMNEPRPPKRRRIAKPLKQLSQPVQTKESEESPNVSSKSQVASPSLNDSIDSRFFKVLFNLYMNIILYDLLRLIFLTTEFRWSYQENQVGQLYVSFAFRDQL